MSVEQDQTIPNIEGAVVAQEFPKTYLGIDINLLTGDDLWAALGEPHPFLADVVQVVPTPEAA